MPRVRAPRLDLFTSRPEPLYPASFTRQARHDARRPARRWPALDLRLWLRGGLDPHPRAVLAHALVLDGAVDQREQRPVAPDADVRSRVHARAHLSDQDVAGPGLLACEHLDAPSLPLAVAAVAAAALSLLVGHAATPRRSRSRAPS